MVSPLSFVASNSLYLEALYPVVEKMAEVKLVHLVLIIVVILCLSGYSNGLSLYQYFTNEDGESTSLGLVAEHPDFFLLNGKQFRIYGGSMDYIRVHPDHWRDRLRKMKAAGLNTVFSSVPWNFHQPSQRVIDFGNGGSEISPFLDIRKFMKIAREEDLFVILKVGPFVDNDLEFGGIPGWLYKPWIRGSTYLYMRFARDFQDRLVGLLRDLQFHSRVNGNGGPLIAIQIEHEYGNFGYPNYVRDVPYLQAIADIWSTNNSWDTFMFTSDIISINQDHGSVDDIFMAASSVREDPLKEVESLKKLQPGKPVFISEFETGSPDFWFGEHNEYPYEEFKNNLAHLAQNARNVSINFHMFHGGSNFWFANGGVMEDDSPFFSPSVSSFGEICTHEISPR